jgi:non-specific serine/threonine protein kinase
VSASGGILTHESGLVLDLSRRELRARGVSVPIGGRAFEILAILAQSGQELVGKDELMQRVWPGAIVEENTLQAHIAAIRKALGADRDSLKTVSGRGYRLVGNWTPRAASGSAQPPSPEPSSVAGQGSRTNLPVSPIDLVGRAFATHHVEEVLTAHRVVTLTGPGGIGKTALALQVAQRVFTSTQVDAYFVNLASLSDPHLVPSTIASILDVRLGSEESDAASVARAIGARQLLLVIDNCEHLIDAVANMTETMIQMCRGVSVLATSRENLRIVDEYVYRVGPLSIPTEQDLEPDVSRRARSSCSWPESTRPKPPFRPTRRTSYRLLQCAGDSMVFRSRSNLLQRAPPRLGSPKWRPDWMIVLGS